jgi:hypothetical protein
MEGKAERLFPARTSSSFLNLVIPGVCPIRRGLVLGKFKNMPLLRELQIGPSSFRPIRSGATHLGFQLLAPTSRRVVPLEFCDSSSCLLPEPPIG